jgi:hypothetical protein
MKMKNQFPQPLCNQLVTRFFNGALVAISSLAFALASLDGEQTKPSASQVPAVYLYNFGKFIQWPATAAAAKSDSCVLGHDPFGPILSTAVAGGIIGGKGIIAKRVIAVQQAVSCQIQFISDGNSVRFEVDLAATQSAGLRLSSELLKVAAAVKRNPAPDGNQS